MATLPCCHQLKKEHIHTLLSFINSEPSRVVRPGWVVAKCPFAPWLHDAGVDKNPSFGISVREHGESRFNCFSCNKRGWLGDLVPILTRMCPKEERPAGYDLGKAYQVIVSEETAELYGSDVPDYDKHLHRRDHDFAFSEEWMRSFMPATNFPEAMEYLHSRYMTVEMVKHFNVRFDTSQDRVCFPIRNWKGELVGLHGRLIRPKAHEFEPIYRMYRFMEDKNVLPWFGEHEVDPRQRVIVTESVFDRTNVWRYHKNVIAPLSAGIGKLKIERIERCKDVITLFDNGKGGDSARAQMDKYFKGKKLRHLKPPGETDDAGVMTYDQMESTLSLYIKTIV